MPKQATSSVLATAAAGVRDLLASAARGARRIAWKPLGVVPLLLCWLVLGSLPAAGGADVVVFAAESLREALDEAAKTYGESARIKIAASYGGTHALAKQIAAGARADVFIAGTREPMDKLEARALIRPESRVDLLGNWLVLVAPRDSLLSLRIAPGFPLVGALGTRRLAVPDMEASPAGRAVKAALEHLGVWADVRNQLLQAPTLRATLRMVATGEAPLGVVFATDALIEPRVKVVDAFPEDSYPPIVYAAALTGRAGPAAEGFFEFLKSVEGRALFERRGFTILGR